MLALNCVNARTRTQAEFHLEVASKEAEDAFNAMQLKEDAAETLRSRIDATKHEARVAHERLLQRLQERKTRIEGAIEAIDHQLAEKRLLLEERTRNH